MHILSSILHEYGEIHDVKIFWDVLEMKYNMEGSEKVEDGESGVVKNGDFVESIIIVIKTESMSAVDNRVTHDSEELPMWWRRMK